jgi:hypothetical protein
MTSEVVAEQLITHTKMIADLQERVSNLEEKLREMTRIVDRLESNRFWENMKNGDCE